MKRTAAVMLAALAACATSRSSAPPAVTDADLGRLAPNQMGAVTQARQAVFTARDELARAKLRQEQVQGETAYAQADRTAADADAQRAAALARQANDSREPTALQAAQQAQQQAALRRQAADAHRDWASKITAARATAVTAAQRRVDLTEAQLELAKLQALQAANVPAASKYDAKALQARVDQARQASDQAFSQGRAQETEALVAQRRYEDLNRQLQAYLGAPQRG